MILDVQPGRPVTGSVTVPGDKSISHRALMLAALAGGTSEVRGISDGDDVARTAGAIAAMGARLEVVGRGQGHHSFSIEGGPRRLHEPAAVLDLGNSGTGLRLLAGLVSGFPWLTVLTGDASLLTRPMDRISVPLTRMGARVDGRQDGSFPPLAVRGGNLSGIDYTPPMSSAQVKSAILLAGLRADGETIVREVVTTRSHTEEMLEACGVGISVVADNGGQVVTLTPGPLDPFSMDVPGDPSQAAFWVVAACIVPGSEVRIPHVYGGPERIGFVSVLQRMGGDVTVESSGGADRTLCDITARYAGRLQATTVAGEEIPSLDEVPALAVAAAVAEGTTVFSGLEELRGKETDRLSTVSSMVTGLGGTVEVAEGPSLVVKGGPLTGGTVESHGDHRIAMAGAVGGLVGSGPTTIHQWEVVATSYPLFADHLRQLSWGLS